jgi:glycosyltransferase involved in cell wall biosynthesis
MHLAWFSPVPPVKSGIAGRSAELVESLRRRGHTIDIYVDEPVARVAHGVASAHDFLWRHRLRPYDLTVYQFGNASHHDYEWPYALHHPGLVVLHDTHLHHARAALLLRETRVAEYRAEFRWSHPEVSPDVAELAVAGFDSRLFYNWPMVRSLVEASRLVAVHGEGARAELIGALQLPDASSRIASIRLGEGHIVTPEREAQARIQIRRRYGIAEDAVVFGCFGGLTPEKRIHQILAAFRAILPHAPGARLLLAGAPAAHYDIVTDIAAGIDSYQLQDRVTLTGYLDADEDLTDHLAACDVSLNLRWPTARETSGPWLRALAAGRPTIITDLVHMGDVPSLDPRSWTANDIDPRPSSPVCIAIDILDEDHSLRLAMRRLASDAALRDELGRAAREWWAREHSLEAMVEDYERVMQQAACPEPGRGASRSLDEARDRSARARWPAHMRDVGDRKLRALLDPFGVELGRRSLGKGGAI